MTEDALIYTCTLCGRLLVDANECTVHVAPVRIRAAVGCEVSRPPAVADVGAMSAPKEEK